MIGTQIMAHSLLRDTPGFLGVFSVNHLPCLTRNAKCAFIFNSDACESGGTHWLACAFDGKGMCVYFDSFGLPIISSVVRNYCRLHATRVICSNVQIQDFESESCGQFCILFCRAMLKKFNLDSFLKGFSRDTITNEIIVLSQVT